MKPILEIQSVSKKFRLRHEQKSYLSLRESLMGIFRKDSSTNEDFYALKNVSYNVEPGESLGIIGKNGAGKSTLLKILSKITPPSSGKIIVRGRIASLLEVGTGFHPELSGRENIYLNGSILGMKRKEIAAKFDEIVDFSGTEKFLDTPLKHFSSGMQLRLAFSVAAFLEPEILVIDEVLAVGDAEFQKKCIGKMEDVSRSGRTILFVSHNIGAVNQLCKSAILLESGTIKASGKTSDVSRAYLESATKSGAYEFNGTKKGGIYFTSVQTIRNDGKPAIEFMHNESVGIVADIRIEKYQRGTWICFALLDKLKFRVFSLIKPLDEFYDGKDSVKLQIELPASLIAPNHYSLLAALYFPGGGHTDWLEDICPITITDNGTEFSPYTDYGSIILHDLKWSKT
jgi:lipopolysaccharide transport system ATP-binding protein